MRRRAIRICLAVVAMAFAVVACEPNNQGYEPTQPIAFSHAVHAGANQIPCIYCHYGVERGRFAGIPPAHVCMNCHSHVFTDKPEIQKIKHAIDTNTPIAWQRANFIPDFAYFDHQPHIRAGVACDDCHGPVASMGRVNQFAPLTMGFCLDCHRQKAAVAPLLGTAEVEILTDCATCHH